MRCFTITNKYDTRSIEIITCPKCDKTNYDLIDRMIYHDNNHVWPGYAGEPDGHDYGGSDF